MQHDVSATALGPGSGISIRGGNGSEQGALELDITGLAAEDSRARLSCTALTKRGVPCGKVVGVRAYDDGPRCPSHKPRLAVDAPRAPVRSLRVPSDAIRLASWAAIEAAEGRMAASRANSVANVSREFRRSYEAAGLHELVAAQQRVLDAILRFAEQLPPGASPRGEFLRDRAVEAALAKWRVAVARWRQVAG
jgi:hypothetical protein